VAQVQEVEHMAVPRILIVGEDPSVLARTIRETRVLGYDVVGVTANADLRHLWRNERFDAVVLRAGIDDDTRSEFLDDIRERSPDLPIFDRDDPEEAMGRFLASVVETLGS
jgi:DNA-binding response OmpR family regulator